jgi:hypothetical protein
MCFQQACMQTRWCIPALYQNALSKLIGPKEEGKCRHCRPNIDLPAHFNWTRHILRRNICGATCRHSVVQRRGSSSIQVQFSCFSRDVQRHCSRACTRSEWTQFVLYLRTVAHGWWIPVASFKKSRIINLIVEANVVTHGHLWHASMPITHHSSIFQNFFWGVFQYVLEVVRTTSLWQQSTAPSSGACNEHAACFGGAFLRAMSRKKRGWAFESIAVGKANMGGCWTRWSCAWSRPHTCTLHTDLAHLA